jgi:hypothetical protein
MTQKLNKSIKKMKANLEEVLETQRILLQTKAAEKVKNALLLISIISRSIFKLLIKTKLKNRAKIKTILNWSSRRI